MVEAIGKGVVTQPLFQEKLIHTDEPNAPDGVGLKALAYAFPLPKL
jgi:hypothetical protein